MLHPNPDAGVVAGWPFFSVRNQAGAGVSSGRNRAISQDGAQDEQRFLEIVPTGISRSGVHRLTGQAIKTAARYCSSSV
jgi:hypothetical protein